MMPVVGTPRVESSDLITEARSLRTSWRRSEGEEEEGEEGGEEDGGEEEWRVVAVRG